MDEILDKANLSIAAEIMIDQLVREAHNNAVKHGFYAWFDEARGFLLDSDRPELSRDATRSMVLAQLAKVCAEAGEAVDRIQRDDMAGLGEELADVVIRVMDLAGFLGVDFGKAVIGKMKKNRDRPYLHGKVC